jgi:hypothetical protein
MVKVFIWWALQSLFGVLIAILMFTETWYWFLSVVVVWAAQVLLSCANCRYPIWLDYRKHNLPRWLPRFPSETCARCRKPVDHRLL